MHSKGTATIAGVLLLAALGSLWFTLRSEIPPVNHQIYTSLGYVLAREAATAVHDRGQVVAVIAASSSTLWREQWQAFTDELKKHAQIGLTTRVVGSDGERPPLQQIIDQNTQVAGIVFFAGFPEFEELQALTNQQQAPKIILIGNPDMPAKDYYTRFFTTGSLAALILSRSFSDTGQPEHPKTAREWFDKYYRLYTPQNYESLPE